MIETPIRDAVTRLTGRLTDATPDAELLDRFVADGDRHALTGLIQRHSPTVLAACRDLLWHREDVEDACQATFLALTKQAKSIRSRASVPGWLRATARRICLNLRRGHARRQSRERHSLAEPSALPEAELLWGEVRDAIDEEIARLPRRYRTVFLRRCLDDQPRAEVAIELGIPEGTVASRTDTAKRILRDRLASRGIDLSAVLPVMILARESTASVVPFPPDSGAGRAAALAASAGRALVPVKPLIMAALVGIVLAGVMVQGTAPSPAKDDPVGSSPDRTETPEGGMVARLGTVKFRQPGDVFEVHFAPDGKTLISCIQSTIDPLGRLARNFERWDVATGEPTKEYLPPKEGERSGYLRTTAYSPDGKYIAAANEHAGLWVWDAEKAGEPILVVPLKPMDPHTMEFSPDGKVIAVASWREPPIRLFVAATGEELPSLPGHPRGSSALAFSPDGKHLAASGDGEETPETLTVWDLTTRERVWEAASGPNTTRDIAYSRDGKVILGGCLRTARLWDAASGRDLLKIEHDNEDLRLRAVAISKDGRTLITAGTDAVIRFWDRDSGRLVRTITDFRGYVRSLDVSPDGKILASGGGSSVHLWDMGTGRPLFPGPGHHDRINDIAVSPDGRWLASAGDDRVIILWDLRTGEQRRVFAGHGYNVSAVAFSPDSRTLASGSNNDDPSIRLWDVATGEQTAKLDGHVYVSYLQFTPDGDRLLSGDGIGKASIRVWDLTGNEPKPIRDLWPIGKPKEGEQPWDGASLSAIAFSRDGRRVATSEEPPRMGFGTVSGPVKIWDLTTGKEILNLNQRADGLRTGFLGQIRSLAFTPDGKSLFIPTEQKVCLRELRADSFADEIEASADAIAVSDDGRMFATAARYRSTKITLWETATRKQRAEFDGHNGMVMDIEFTPDGRTLASASADTTVMLWDLTLAGQVDAPADQDQLTGHWRKLGSDDATEAYRSMCALARAPALARPFLAEQLKPAEEVAAEEIDRLIGQLGDGKFAVREAATRQLTALGRRAESRLRNATQGDRNAEAARRIEALLGQLESVTPEELRRDRGEEVLRMIGASER